MNALHKFSRRAFIRATAALGVGSLTWPNSCLAAELGGHFIGCYTRPWDQFDYRVALDGIAGAGFKHAGLMTANGKPSNLINVDTTPDTVAAIAAEVKSRGLKTLSIYGGDFPVAKSVEAGV